MLYREIIAVCSAIHPKNWNRVCVGQNFLMLNWWYILIPLDFKFNTFLALVYHSR